MDAELELELGPLHVAIGNLSDEVKELRQRLAFMQDDLLLTGTGTCPNPSATFAIDLGHPMAGKWWQVRQMIVGGSDITTTPAGIGWVVVQAENPSANPPLFNVRDFTSGTLPQRAFYGTHELVVQQNEHLWVVITAGTAGTQYAVSAMVENFPQFVKSSL